MYQYILKILCKYFIFHVDFLEEINLLSKAQTVKCEKGREHKLLSLSLHPRVTLMKASVVE